MKELQQALIKRFREALGDNLVALAFFGSSARQETREGSDIDVLLLAHQLPDDPFERRWFVDEIVFGLGKGRLSVLARTVEEFCSDISPLHLDLGLVEIAERAVSIVLGRSS